MQLYKIIKFKRNPQLLFEPRQQVLVHVKTRMNLADHSMSLDFEKGYTLKPLQKSC